MKLTKRQIATTVAALRNWQTRNVPAKSQWQTKARMQSNEATAAEHGPALDAEEIDILCDKLNREGGK